MASDFVQDRLADLPDLKVTYDQPQPPAPRLSSGGPEDGARMFCGEAVRPGVGPGVLVSATRVWRDGKQMITDVDSVFPAGAAAAMCPQPPPEQLSVSARLWTAASSVTMLVVGAGAKFLLRGINTTVVHGSHNLDTIFREDAERRPVVSVINHHSCFDDPGLWGAVLSPAQLLDTRHMRWGASASEVIFSSRPLETFWKLGKVVPIVRGWGVQQPAMDFLLDKLNRGGWVNIFPEGKVTVTEAGLGSFRWGVGRLIWDCDTAPTLLPVLHCGMDSVLPNPASASDPQPCVVRPGNLVTVNIGPPEDLRPLVAELRARGVEAAEARQLLTAHVAAVMARLHRETRDLHRANIARWLRRWHDTTDLVPSLMT